ncbi:MAG: helix-turn-helix transcriptional regulator [Chloroflexota bacterium]
MAQNLWELRQIKRMTVKQLAGKSGIKTDRIYAYENGEPIKMADLDKLAKALFVNKNEIKIQSDPMQKKKPAPPQQAVAAPAAPKPAAPSAPPAKQPPTKKPPAAKPTQTTSASEGQLDYLRVLIAKLNEDETAVSERLGKPLEELAFPEARQLLNTYHKAYKARQDQRPPDTRRKRGHLPEVVDDFEIKYLQTQQEAGTVITFTLFDKTEFSGRIIGFSPYNITIQQADDSEVTIQKLALAYYTAAKAAS